MLAGIVVADERVTNRHSFARTQASVNDLCGGFRELKCLRQDDGLFISFFGLIQPMISRPRSDFFGC